ncbi:DNA polymerase I [Candidatus Erwinia haradaeae]|uniref:DNA polymerase I n=1 Tax=Candidatus Erwinia haradaeae TaxID=1922217 RepID=A0A451DBV9_9GAMM|nr:DNA polymerase I [Candidatus Erwinia haradaeae]VFP83903.1 DNA polymerase I [Candidatus Erwinia haradaeae]
MMYFTEKSLILVDGSSYLYRAYHACPRLTTDSGFPTGAMYGMLNMLRSLLLKYQHSHVAVVFDAPGKTFRDALFIEYKSHRPIMPYELQIQLEPLQEIIKSLGLPLLVIPGVEADDVIGTLALEAEKLGQTVLISTDDKDMAQLVSQNINIINSIDNRMMGPQEVFEKYGIPSSLIIDLLALVGDTSDNIPGVAGVGKKSAQALLQGLGGIQVIYKNLDKVASLPFRGSKNIALKLEKNKGMAFLSYELATIKTDVQLSLTSNQLTYTTPTLSYLLELLKKYEFNQWLSHLENKTWWRWHCKAWHIIEKRIIIEKEREDKKGAINTFEPTTYLDILDKVTFSTWIENIKNSKYCAFYIETDSLDVFTANIVGLSFSTMLGKAVYLPVSFSKKTSSTQLDGFYILEMLQPVLENMNLVKIGCNLKFYYKILKKYNINLQGLCFDVFLESYVLDSIGNCRDLYILAERWLHYDLAMLTHIVRKKRHKPVCHPVLIGSNNYCAAIHADVTLQLHTKMWTQLEQKRDLKYIFEEIDMPLVPVLSRIEQNGVLIDKKFLSEYSKEISSRLTNLELQAHEFAGESFNLFSPKQLQVILFKKHGIKSTKKTPGGDLSTSEEVLSQLSLHYPLAKVILEHRCLSKIQSSYTNKLLRMIHPDTQRVHTSYHQTVTVTGRLSSSNPNLQNIPVRNNEGRRVRKAFVAPQGYSIIVADYSQIELRIMAHFSQDAGLLLAFSKEQDVHCATAAEVFGVDLPVVTKEQRRSAKAINFGLIYGMSAFGLARQLCIGVGEAKIYIDRYFGRYPGVLHYMRNTRKKAAEQGYVSTLHGRRLYLPDINARNGIRRQAAERAAINAPMQGTAADIMKLAMISIDIWLAQQKFPLFRMIMQVHDELVFEVKSHSIAGASMQICALMEGCIHLDVPLRVDIGIGENWDQAH